MNFVNALMIKFISIHSLATGTAVTLHN